MRARLPLLAALILALLLGVAFYFMLWMPRSQEQADLEDEIALLQSRQAQLTNEIRQLEEIQANELQIRAALARLEEYIPTGAAQPTVIRQLQLSADAAGVQIDTVTFGSPAIVQGAPATGDPTLVLAAIPVDLVTVGGYFQQVDLFRRLEVDVSRAVLISDVTMVESEVGFPSLSTTWSGTMYALVPTDTPPPPPSDDDEDDDESGGDPEDAA